MTSIKLIVTGASARAEVDGLLTSGMVGIPVTTSYDSAWDGLKKTLVCRGGSVVRTILDVDGTATVPHECMIANATLQIGVEGRNADGTLVIPTVWARCGLICSGANAEADPSTDPTLPVWAQIQAMIGSLDDLETEAKNNLVDAVNEAMAKGGGEVDPKAVQQIVEDYLAANPPTITETDPTVPAWAKQPEKPSYTAYEVGALSAETLPEAINTALAQAKASGDFDGADGAPGKDGSDGQPGENGTDGYSPTANVTQNDNGATITITDKNGTTTATVTNGKDGADGNPGADGSPGKDGADGKSAYAYAVEGGYSGTEAEFAAKLAMEMPDKLPNPNALTFTGAVTGSYDGSAPLNVEIPSGGPGGDPTIIFDSGEIAEEVNLIGPIDISKYSRLRILGKAYPSENSAGKRAAQLYFGDINHRLLCNAGTGKLFDTSGNPVSFLIYLNVGANALSAFSFSGFNAMGTFDDSTRAVSSQAATSDGGCLIYSTTYDLTQMYLSAQDDLVARPWGVGTRIMVIGDD